MKASSIEEHKKSDARNLMCIIFIVIIMLMLINTTLTSYHQVGERLVPLPAFSVWQIYTDPLDCKSIV